MNTILLQGGVFLCSAVGAGGAELRFNHLVGLEVYFVSFRPL